MQPQLYERLYTEIEEIGNRVLHPVRKEQRTNKLSINDDRIVEDIVTNGC